MKIIEKIKKLEELLKKANSSNEFVDYEKIKSSFHMFLDKLLNKNIIDKQSYDILIGKLYNQKIITNNIYNNDIRTASIKNKVIFTMLVTCIALIHYGIIKQTNKDNNIKNEDIVRNEVFVQKYKEPEVPKIEKQLTKKVSNSELLSKSFSFIVQFEGKLLGNVYDNTGKIIARNVHVVYDDKLPMGDPNKKWDGHPNTLEDFIDNCVGKPTIGYGTTETSIVNKGYISNQLAVSEAIKSIQNTIRETKVKIGIEHWNKLNINQMTALISLYYNTGGKVKTPKLIGFIQEGDYKNAAKEFLDIVKSDDKVVPGLVKRRRDEAKLFLTPVN